MELAARAATMLRAEITAEVLHVIALIDLQWADSAGNSLPRSISYLQSASRLADRRAPVLTDLSAAYLAWSERSQNPRDLLAALEAAEEAVALEPNNQAARFNVALALDRIGLDEEASAAWAEYLAADASSPWAAEARRYLETKRDRTPVPTAPEATSPDREVHAYAAEYPQQALLHGWDRVLDAWGAAEMAGDSAGAEAWLGLAAELGDALERQGGDATLADATRAIVAARVHSAGTAAPAAAHREYAAGRASFVAARYEEADRHYEAALREALASTPLRQWATLGHAATLAYAGQTARGERLLVALAAEADTLRHPALAARVRSSLGSLLFRAGRQTEAHAWLSEAARFYARIGEEEHLMPPRRCWRISSSPAATAAAPTACCTAHSTACGAIGSRCGFTRCCSWPRKRRPRTDCRAPPCGCRARAYGSPIEPGSCSTGPRPGSPGQSCGSPCTTRSEPSRTSPRRMQSADPEPLTRGRMHLVPVVPVGCPTRARRAAGEDRLPPSHQEPQMKRLLIPLSTACVLAACNADAPKTTIPTAPSYAAGGACPAPAVQGAEYLPARDPKLASTLQSTFQPGDPIVWIEFANTTCQTVHVFWIDYDGERVLYNTLQAGESYFQGSYIGHPWVVVGARTGDLVVFGPTEVAGVALVRQNYHIPPQAGRPALSQRPTDRTLALPVPPRP